MEREMKVMVLSATHNVGGSRGPIHEMFCKRMAHVRDVLGIELLVVGSDGLISRSITEKHGHLYLEHQNKPVSNKMNAGMRLLREHDPDYVITLDSDDFMSDSLFAAYLDAMSVGEHSFVGVTDSYFVSFHLKRAHFDKCFHWDGYKNGTIIMGCSKAMRRDVLDSVEWEPWPEGKNYALNNHSHRRLSQYSTGNAKRHRIGVLDGGHMHIDIKTNGNISSVAPLWKGRPLLDFDQLMRDHFPAEEAEGMVSFRHTMLSRYPKNT